MTRRGMVVGTVGLGIVMLCSILAPILAPHHWAEQDLSRSLLPPGSSDHLLGTDALGRDLLTRLLYGSRISLLVATVATLVSIVIGVAYGAISGYAGGFVDSLMMRVIDVLYSLPFLFLVILVMTLFLGPKATPAARIIALLVVLGAVQWLTMARIVRGQVLSLRNREFIEAAKAMGAGPARIIFRHLVPNLLPVVTVYATLTVPRVILQEAFLSFLGLGIPEPHPSWGRLTAEGVRAITPVETHWWLVVFPAAAITCTLLALNLVGEGLSDRLVTRGRGKASS